MPLITNVRPRVNQETTYGLVADAGHKLCQDKDAFLATIDCVQKWVSNRYAYDLPPEAERHETFMTDEGGHRVETISMLEDGLWAVRWSHPDLGLGDEMPPVPGRHLTVDISVRRTECRPLFAIRVTCSTPHGVQAPVNYVRPYVVRLLAAKIGLEHEIPLSEEPWRIRSEDDLAALESLVTSHNRQMPVILISEIDKRKWDYSPHPKEFMVDGLFLAGKALGYAHVFLLPYALGFHWTNRVGHNWTAYDGSVRLYMPELDFSEDTGKKHPVAYKRQIHEFSYKEQSGSNAFGFFLADRLASYGAHSAVLWDEAIFVPQARVTLADHRARHIAKLTDVSEIRVRYEAQINALRQQLHEAENEAEQWSDASVQASHDRDYYKDENEALRRQTEVLRANLESKTGKPADEDVPIPDSYDDMPEWVSENLAGRVVLLPRAVNALKGATYNDVGLVYRSLLFLANEYRKHRSGYMDFDTFRTTAKAELGLDCSGSIEKNRAGEFGDTYFVSYPIGSRNKEFLCSHLRKGSTKNDRYCLAIYFFWDDETKQVIVGWLPSHLKNRMT